MATQGPYTIWRLVERKYEQVDQSPWLEDASRSADFYARHARTQVRDAAGAIVYHGYHVLNPGTYQ
jgi:hypothetical protein